MEGRKRGWRNRRKKEKRGKNTLHKSRKAQERHQTKCGNILGEAGETAEWFGEEPDDIESSRKRRKDEMQESDR